ncbi:VPLPA-CTERM sorting domain-containing protein [Roseibium sp.]|uniref:VPLPA-CTERM sorting domain-containing protein n=1 Tax=Roseibium sp. TaxID=1936156 RepID=UPI003BAD593F
MNIFKTIKAAAIAAVLSVATVSAVSAAPSSIRFGGVIDSITAPGTGGSVLGAVEFGDVLGAPANPTPGAGGWANINAVSGIFLPEAAGSLLGYFYNIDFDNIPVNPFWVTDFFSFSIDQLVDGPDFEFNNPGGVFSDLDFKAKGTLTVLGTGDTYTGVASFSADSSNGIDIAFSSTATVPLPASVLLLGGALVGAGAVARRRKKATEVA